MPMMNEKESEYPDFAMMQILLRDTYIISDLNNDPVSSLSCSNVEFYITVQVQKLVILLSSHMLGNILLFSIFETFFVSGNLICKSYSLVLG